MSITAEITPSPRILPHWRIGFDDWLKDQLPKRFRRMLFIGTALGILGWIPNVDEAVIHQVNQMMGLANDPAAIELPVLKYRWIWRDIPTIPRTTDIPDFRQLAQTLINTSPMFIRYGTIDEVAVDLQTLYNIAFSFRTLPTQP